VIPHRAGWDALGISYKALYTYLALGSDLLKAHAHSEVAFSPVAAGENGLTLARVTRSSAGDE